MEGVAALIIAFIVATALVATPSIKVNQYGDLPDVKSAHVIIVSAPQEKYTLLNLVKQRLNKKKIALTNPQDCDVLIFVYAQPLFHKYATYEAARHHGQIGKDFYSGTTYVPMKKIGSRLQIGMQILDKKDNCLWEAWSRQGTIIAKYKTTLTKIIEECPL